MSLMETVLVHNYRAKTVFKYALCTKDATFYTVEEEASKRRGKASSIF